MTSWAPSAFKQQGLSKGYDPEFLKSLVDLGNEISKKDIPIIFTLGHLAFLTDVPYKYLNSVVSRYNKPYRTFQIKKRSGGFRRISIPDFKLLIVQKWIHRFILSKIETSLSSTAYGTGCSPFKNSQRHCGATWLIKLDITNFFESISERQVFHVFQSLGYSRLLSFQMTRLTTYINPNYSDPKHVRFRWISFESKWKIPYYYREILGHLPQGAPTSPLLANLVCRKMDVELEKLAQISNCVYSRYADDIVFSSSEIDRRQAVKISGKIFDILEGVGFKANTRKTKIIPPGAKKVVTGLVVNGEIPTLGKEFRDQLRAHLYFSKKIGVLEHCRKRKFRSLFGLRNHVNGLITYASSVDKAFGEKCRIEFEQLNWPEVMANIP